MTNHKNNKIIRSNDPHLLPSTKKCNVYQLLCQSFPKLSPFKITECSFLLAIWMKIKKIDTCKNYCDHQSNQIIECSWIW